MHPLLASFPVVFEQVVDWGDMDGFAHVNNVVYFRYFETRASSIYGAFAGWKT